MFEDYKERMALKGRTMGSALKNQSDVIMDATFRRDVAYRKCYLLDKGVIFPDQTLEAYKKAKAVFAGKENYNPKEMHGWHPVDCKYLVRTYYSIQGDSIDYYLQFRPHAHGLNPNIRVGAFVFVPDDLGVYKLWLIVARDDKPQFPQFYILACDRMYKWYISESDRIKYEGTHVDTGSYFTWGVQRTQSSYNSGVWTDYYTTAVENQLKAWLQTNDDTETITYNQHFVISNNAKRRIAWEVSKYEDSTTLGLTKLTFKQEQEYDPVDNKSWINLTSENYSDTQTGIEYDFYCPRSNDLVSHSPSDVTMTDTSVISYSGLEPTIKVGGSYKTLTANLYKYGVFVNNKPYWHIEFYKQDALICSFDFSYNGDQLICVDPNVNVNNNEITYSENGKKIFGILFKHDSNASSQLKIKCASIIDMVGGKIKVIADDDADSATASAFLNLEVVSL